MSSQSQSPLDQHQKVIKDWLAEGRSYGEIVDGLADLGLPTSDRSLRRALDRWGLCRPGSTPQEPSGLTIEGDQATATSGLLLAYTSPDDLLKERGLEPEDWEVKSVTVNEWDGAEGDIKKQLKVHARRKQPIYVIQPAEIDITIPESKAKRDATQPRTIVCVGDQQAPYHNKYLHHAFQSFLADVQPDEGVFIGDTADLPKISRHADEPDWAATTQQCVTATGQIIYDYRVASPHTVWKKLGGNHDERLRTAVINNLADFYGLRPAEVETLPELPPIHHPRLLYR